MEKNENQKKKQTGINSDSYVIIDHEDSNKIESIIMEENIQQIKNSQSILFNQNIKNNLNSKSLIKIFLLNLTNKSLL
jgi:hypothetical protein